MSIFVKHGPFLFLKDEKDMSEEEAQQEEERIQEQLCELMYMQQQYHRIIKEQRYALRGSKLCCQYGTEHAGLNCLRGHGILWRGLPLLTIVDCTTENIHSFGSCLCPEVNYMGRLPMTITSDPKCSPAELAPGNIFPHICVPLIGEGDRWKQIDGDLLAEVNAQEYEPLLTDNAVLVCQYGGIISICEVPDAEEEEKTQLVTMEQMKKFGFEITYKGLEKLNRLLEENGITDRGSIALFLATCGHESAMGTQLLEQGTDEYFAEHGYDRYTRGAGYIQVTKDDQEAFYKSIGVAKDDMPEDRATDIANNYAWEAAVWEWAVCRKGKKVIMNNYVTEYGTSEAVFIITQYFINSYLRKEKYPFFDSDLREMRQNENAKNRNDTLWYYDLEELWEDDKDFRGVLHINGRAYRLPKNYKDRRQKYLNAMEYIY